MNEKRTQVNETSNDLKNDIYEAVYSFLSLAGPHHYVDLVGGLLTEFVDQQMEKPESERATDKVISSHVFYLQQLIGFISQIAELESRCNMLLRKEGQRGPQLRETS